MNAIHHNCGGTIQRTTTTHDSAPWSTCGVVVTTHDNAVHNVAATDGHEVDISPYSLHTLHACEFTEQ